MLEYMSVKQRLDLQKKVGTATPDQMWVFHNETLIFMTFGSGEILDIQASSVDQPCFEHNFVTRRLRTTKRVTAVTYNNGLLLIG